MTIEKAIRIKFLCILIFGISTTTVLEQKKLMDHPDFVDHMLNKAVHDGDDRVPDIVQALVLTFMKTSLLYLYLILTLYYIVLVEAEDVITKFMALFGKFMVLVTIILYVVSECFLSVKEMYVLVTRLAVTLFMISFFQVIYLIVAICQNYFPWHLCTQISCPNWRDIYKAVRGRPRHLEILQETIV